MPWRGTTFSATLLRRSNTSLAFSDRPSREPARRSNRVLYCSAGYPGTVSGRNLVLMMRPPDGVVLPARRLSDDGLNAWQQVLDRGYEGLVAKDPTSPYVGGRTVKWLKVKQPLPRRQSGVGGDAGRWRPGRDRLTVT